jgi:hypothetical protein
MAKKRKSKTSEFDALEAEKPTSLPRAEIQNLIHALETKDSIPMLKSTILEWTSESEDENIVGSPSFLEDNSTLTTETKSIH